MHSESKRLQGTSTKSEPFPVIFVTDQIGVLMVFWLYFFCQSDSCDKQRHIDVVHMNLKSSYIYGTEEVLLGEGDKYIIYAIRI